MRQLLLIFISFSVFTTVQSQINSTNSISKKETKATECSKLIFKFGDGMSRLPAVVMRNLNEAKAEMDDFSETDYKLQKFTVTVLYSKSQTFKTANNIGKLFSEETKSILNLLKPNDIVVVTGISAINSKGETIYLPERTFGLY